jgi:chemotaxis signal transduction protein
MSGTREAFQRLTGNLLNHLSKETRRKAVTDLRAKAQIGIDILVRNLFERTADIGFLSADDDVREFLLHTDRPRSVLENRFREYVEKYSVYSDIVLFDRDGKIRARLAPHPLEVSQHAILDRARRVGSGSDLVEIATFYIGNQWLGLPATEVVEAIDADGITAVLGGKSELVAGVKMYRGQLISVLHLQRLVQPEAKTSHQAGQIVVVRTRNKICFGLLVDELGEIPEVASHEILPVGKVAGSPGALTVGMVNGLGKPGDHYGILAVIAADRLCLRTSCHCPNESKSLVSATLPR